MTATPVANFGGEETGSGNAAQPRFPRLASPFDMTPASETVRTASRTTSERLIIGIHEGSQPAIPTLGLDRAPYNALVLHATSHAFEHMLACAQLILRSALKREESRGAHLRSDFPKTDDKNWKHHTTINRKDYE